MNAYQEHIVRQATLEWAREELRKINPQPLDDKELEKALAKMFEVARQEGVLRRFADGREDAEEALALLQPKIEEAKVKGFAEGSKLATENRLEECNQLCCDFITEEARRQERERILAWRYEPCPHNEAYEKRECDICWQALKRGE